MRSLRWPIRLSAAVVMLLVAGCGQDVTRPTSRPALFSPNSHPSLSGTYINGNVVTATDDEGGTIAVDRANHTATFNGETVILTQEAADSLADQLSRMYNVEMAADEVLNAPPPPPPDEPMCDDPSAPCDVGHALTPVLAPTIDDGPITALPLQGTGNRIVRAPPAIGSFLPRAEDSNGLVVGLNSVVGDDPGFSCTDISLAIYNKMPNYKLARKAILVALGKEGGKLVQMAKQLPQLPGDPTTWFAKAELYTAGPILDYLYANFETARMELDILAIQFRIKGCYTPPSSPPPSGGGGSGGSSGGKECYWEITYIVATGEVIDVRLLGCW